MLFSEAWSSISMNLSTTFAATMTVLIGMFLLGLFIALGTWVLSWSNHVKSELQVKVYFAGTATPAQEYAVGQKIRGRPAREDRRLRLARRRRRRSMEKEFPELYKTKLPSNPLPDAGVVTPTKGEYTPKIGQMVQRAHCAGVDDVTGEARRHIAC